MIDDRDLDGIEDKFDSTFNTPEELLEKRGIQYKDNKIDEVQMCVGLRGNYFNDFSVFNHTDSIDLSTVINHPDKKTAKQILSNVKKWQSGSFVTVKDGVATITQNGKAVLASAGFKAASVPLTEGTVAAVGNVPGAVIVATKKVVTAVAKAVQTATATQKR